MKNYIKQLLPPTARKIIQVLYRRITSPMRALPDFLIIGAQKGGTTSLYYYLVQHPQIRHSTTKEIHFFDRGSTLPVEYYKKRQNRYRTHFPLISELKNNIKTGEATPVYIFHPEAAGRIAYLLPDVKLIVLLRNPSERAISQFFHQKIKKYEPLSMMEAFQAEETRLGHLWKNKNYDSEDFRRFSYKSRGLYQEQLERYFDYFPREQMLILNSEEFFQDPRSSLERVYGFLGVDQSFLVRKLKPRNVSINRARVPQAVYDYLDEFFATPNQVLFQLLGRAYDW
jgi:hypothetical protein